MKAFASKLLSAGLLAFATVHAAIPSDAAVSPPALTGAASRKVHGPGTFDLPLSLVSTNPTTEPRSGGAGGDHTIVFTFDKPVTGGTVLLTEGIATPRVATFVGAEMRVPISGVANQQYVSLAVSSVTSSDGGTGGAGSVRVGFLLGDVNQNRVVALSDLGLVNAQVAQVVTAGNFLRDVNASGTLSLADKGITNAQVTKGLPAVTCDSLGCVVMAAGGFQNPKLIVPPGAIPPGSPVAITMADLGGDASDASVFRVYLFGPAGTTFATPATVDLPAPPLLADEEAVIEVSDDGVNWTEVATTLANGRVTGPITHFSRCRTRHRTGIGSKDNDIILTDMVGYQDILTGLPNPTPGEPGSCYTGDVHGICFKLKNITASRTITSTCPPPPTPTNPPPAGCLQIHLDPWQCYTSSRNFPGVFDPANPTAYEGQHCDITGLVIPCPETVYNLDSFLPPNGLLPGASVWVDLNFLIGSPTPANGVYPNSCGGSSFVGFDLLLREPDQNNVQAGIRSAMTGPFIQIGLGVGNCNPPPPAVSCTRTWEQLISPKPPSLANYPTLKFKPGGAAVKNFLNDWRE